MDTTEAMLREGKRQLLSLGHGVKSAVESKEIESIMDRYDASVIQNTPPVSVDSVVFVITRMVRFHGGQTSILRIGTQLSKFGFRVGYAVYKTQSKAEMELCAKSNLPDYEGEFYTKEELREMIKKKQCPDVAIASSWDTVFYVKKMNSYRMYFVQDFEPYFYGFDEKFLLAKKTYEQGLHMVSLGGWNAEMIMKNCHLNSMLDVVDFPCDSSGYRRKERNFAEYRKKKSICLAVYMKYYGKRLPGIIQYMLEHLAKELQTRDGICLDVRYFGEAKTFAAKGGTNLGMLNQEELLSLYHRADFGMVASMSNISLIPYEMLAAGLPVIEFEDGTFPYYFPENCAILTSVSYKDLYRKMKESMENPELLEARDRNAAEFLNTVSWEKTGVQFTEILRELV